MELTEMEIDGVADAVERWTIWTELRSSCRNQRLEQVPWCHGRVKTGGSQYSSLVKDATKPLDAISCRIYDMISLLIRLTTFNI